MKKHKLISGDLKAAKEANRCRFTQAELETIIVIQKRIIEIQGKELKKLRHFKCYPGPGDELPETD